MKKEIVAEILKSLLSESIKNWSEEELMLKIRNWRAVLVDITDEQGIKGLEKALKLPNSIPLSPGKFREMCITNKSSNSIEEEAKTAWALLINNISSSITPVFKDRAIAKAINQFGGWVPFCLSLNMNNEPFKRMEFIDHYCIAVRSDKVLPVIPDRVNKVFSCGKNWHDCRWIGNFNDEEKQAAIGEIKLLEEQNKINQKLLEKA